MQAFKRVLSCTLACASVQALQLQYVLKSADMNSTEDDVTHAPSDSVCNFTYGWQAPVLSKKFEESSLGSELGDVFNLGLQTFAQVEIASEEEEESSVECEFCDVFTLGLQSLAQVEIASQEEEAEGIELGDAFEPGFQTSVKVSHRRPAALPKERQGEHAVLSDVFLLGLQTFVRTHPADEDQAEVLPGDTELDDSPALSLQRPIVVRKQTKSIAADMHSVQGDSACLFGLQWPVKVTHRASVTGHHDVKRLSVLGLQRSAKLSRGSSVDDDFEVESHSPIALQRSTKLKRRIFIDDE